MSSWAAGDRGSLNMKTRTVHAAAVGLALATLAMGGCLIGSRKVETGTGKEVSAATMSRIEPGVTTRQWVEATLGEPTSKAKLDDGTEVWKWSYSRVEASSGTVLFIFGGSSTKTRAGSAYVEMRDGVVTRAWRTEE
jgi:hypothetical protein